MLARILGVQKALSINLNSFMFNLHLSLSKGLDIILSQEKEFWALKSRINWLIWNDLNVKFLKISAIHNRKLDLIIFLKDSLGNWIFDVPTVKNLAVKHF